MLYHWMAGHCDIKINAVADNMANAGDIGAMNGISMNVNKTLDVQDNKGLCVLKSTLTKQKNIKQLLALNSKVENLQNLLSFPDEHTHIDATKTDNDKLTLNMMTDANIMCLNCAKEFNKQEIGLYHERLNYYYKWYCDNCHCHKVTFQSGFQGCSVKDISWTQLIKHANTHHTRVDFDQYCTEIVYEPAMKRCKDCMNLKTVDKICNCNEQKADPEEKETVLNDTKNICNETSHSINTITNLTSIDDNNKSHSKSQQSPVHSANVSNGHVDATIVIPTNHMQSIISTGSEIVEIDDNQEIHDKVINEMVNHNEPMIKNDAVPAYNHNNNSLLSNNIQESESCQMSVPTVMPFLQNSNTVQNMDDDHVNNNINTNTIKCINCNNTKEVYYTKQQLRCIKFHCQYHRRDKTDKIFYASHEPECQKHDINHHHETNIGFVKHFKDMKDKNKEHQHCDFIYDTFKIAACGNGRCRHSINSRCGQLSITIH